MKILFILTYYYPHWTGLTQYAQRLAEGLAKNDFDVSVLTTQHEINLKTRETIGGVCVLRKPILFRLSRTLFSPLLILSFFQTIRTNDVVIIYLPFAEIFIATLIAKIFGKKVFLVHNGDLVLPMGFFNKIIENFYFYSTKLALSLCNNVIIQTVDYAKQSKLLLTQRSKWKVILPLYPAFEDVHHQTEDMVGFAGRFVEEKGFDVLFNAIPYVLKKRPNIQFIFAGETHISYESFFESHKMLFSQYKGNVVWLGRLNEKQMKTFFRKLTVFVISSRSDCFPSVLVEALLSGVPAVVTDIPGARWPINETGMGLVVPSLNPERLADGIVDVIDNYQKFRKRKVRAIELFNYEQTLRRYIALFTKGN